MTWLILLFALALWPALRVLAAQTVPLARAGAAAREEAGGGRLRADSRDAGRGSLIGQALCAGVDRSALAGGGFRFGVRLCEADGGAEHAFGFNLCFWSVDCAERNCRHPRMALSCFDPTNGPRIALRASANCCVGWDATGRAQRDPGPMLSRL